MNFTASYSRSVGECNQVATVVLNNAPQSALTARNAMKLAITNLGSFKPDGYILGDIKETSITKLDSNDTSNNAGKADYMLVMKHVGTSNYPERLVCQIQDATSANIVNLMRAWCTTALNNPNGYTEYVIISAVATLHN